MIKGISVILIISSFFISCNSKKEKKVIFTTKMSKSVNYIDKNKEKTIISLNDILDFPQPDSLLLFYFTVSDCGSCIERGFQILDYVQSVLPELKSTIVANNCDIKYIKTRYNYTKPIYDDNNKLLKEVPYIYTPYIILLYKGKLINGYYIDNQIELENDIFYVNKMLEIKK